MSSVETSVIGGNAKRWKK